MYSGKEKDRLYSRELNVLLGISVLSLRHKSIAQFNPLKTKRWLLYLKTQSVPRCKHISSRL